MLVLVLPFTVAACASAQYVYVPVGVSGNAVESSRRGKVTYQLPPEAPVGTVRITSGGLVRLNPNAGGKKISAIHVRMLFSNQTGVAPWSVDPQQETAWFPGRAGATAPVFVTSSPPESPTLSVKAGALESLDLYYPLPDGEGSADEIPDFDFHWSVRIGERVIQEMTSFDRVQLHSYAAYPYWYSPWPLGWDYPYGMGWAEPPLIWAAPVAPYPPERPVIIHH
jgi:hypothetical protein